jgi:hypothetical protein
MQYEMLSIALDRFVVERQVVQGAPENKTLQRASEAWYSLPLSQT